MLLTYREGEKYNAFEVCRGSQQSIGSMLVPHQILGEGPEPLAAVAKEKNGLLNITFL